MFAKARCLYKARHNQDEATKIAAEMAGDYASGAVSAQFTVIRFWLILAIIAATIIAGLGLWAGLAWHGAFHIITVIFGGLTFLAIRSWRAVNRKMEDAREKALEMAAQGAEAVKTKWAERDDGVNDRT